MKLKCKNGKHYDIFITEQKERTIVHIVALRHSGQGSNQVEHKEYCLFPNGQYQYEKQIHNCK